MHSGVSGASATFDRSERRKVGVNARHQAVLDMFKLHLPGGMRPVKASTRTGCRTQLFCQQRQDYWTACSDDRYSDLKKVAVGALTAPFVV